jgi:hypothetical protein
VESEDVAQDLEVLPLRLLEVEPEEAAAREELRHPLAVELEVVTLSILDNLAGAAHHINPERKSIENSLK